jgi:hypothetical protein
MPNEPDDAVRLALLLAQLRTPGIDGVEGFYFAQREMPDGTIAEVFPLVMGTARLGVGRPWGSLAYEHVY